MTTVQALFPAPPEAIWQALPAAVTGKTPFYNSQQGTVSFSTSMSLLTWGQNVVVQLSPGPQGTMVTVNSNMKFGLFDWGEGKRIGNRFIAAVASTIRVAPYPQS
ncbi:hypothetical protein [Amycolatopsis sp.]|jgi:hypothetical protein|uniref:hypothetical protein n=1 Tax=Amycolatopsis sp. TaxID=37632 RepID=UPI002DFA1252|nr:hypothetical protein [Amycolatopsis sp.]